MIILLAIVDIAFQYYWIELRKIDLSKNDSGWSFPSHRWNAIIRLVGIIIIAWLKPLSLLLLPLAHFIFQYGLNLVRGKELQHLGNNKTDLFLAKVDKKIGYRNRIIYHFVITIILTGVFIWMAQK